MKRDFHAVRAGLAVFAAFVFLAATPPVLANSEGGLSKAETAKLRAVIAGDHRTAKYRARDGYRHPLEVLSFLGVKPGMTVVEIYPGGGWWTEILAPYLNANGKYYAASYDPDVVRPRYKKFLERYHKKLKSRPDLYGGVVVTEFSKAKTAIAPSGAADRVLTFRNLHNWMKREETKTILATMYRVLKPGGIMGLVEHRGNPKVPQDPKALSGYVNEAAAIKLAESVGFRLVSKSEVNANPRDTKNHPEGVWTLPPSYRLKDKDRAKYAAIGESDRMTLKFVKPAR